MRIQSVEFVLSAGSARECPAEAVAEIAVSGRSNVGKSSLLNSLFARKQLVKVSSTPGKTQRLNYFRVNDAFHIVDLPGYGFAKAPAALRNEWSRMMQEYLRKRRQLVGVVQLIDSRHAPSAEDREMVRWLLDERLPFCLVASKVDKLAKSKVTAALRMIAAELRLPESHPIVAHSSETGEGKPALLAWMEAVLIEAAGG